MSLMDDPSDKLISSLEYGRLHYNIGTKKYGEMEITANDSSGGKSFFQSTVKFNMALTDRL